MRIILALALLVCAGWAAAPAYAVPQGCVAKTDTGACVPGYAPVNPETGTAIKSSETLSIVTANTPAAPQTVAGGNYTLIQNCSAYGTLTIRYLGPDGTTRLTLLAKSAADSGGGTLLALGNGMSIDATVTGTTGCNAKLLRTPY